jgi:hypothetical protein
MPFIFKAVHFCELLHIMDMIKIIAGTLILLNGLGGSVFGRYVSL